MPLVSQHQFGPCLGVPQGGDGEAAVCYCTPKDARGQAGTPVGWSEGLPWCGVGWDPAGCFAVMPPKKTFLKGKNRR